MRIYDVTEVDDTSMIQCTVERDDGSFVVTTFINREQLLAFVREDAIYGTDTRLTAGAGSQIMLRH